MTFCDDDAVGFYNHLGSTGFTRRFNFGDDLAWGSDFERTGVGGHDDIYVDTLDFAYFSGHGSPDGFYFGTNYDGDGNFPFMVHSGPGSPQTYEARWGDIDLEWIFVSACQVLYENGIWDRLWYVFNGLHGITGFHTVEADTPDLGRFFAYYLTDTWGPYCTGDAWRFATINDPAQASWMQAAVYRAVTYIFFPFWYVDRWSDYLPGYGSMSGDPSGTVYLWYTRWQC